tara:strand:+ start:317 stop:511 length:195 start_codon:yes stop_codon:yes gene_type:complete
VKTFKVHAVIQSFVEYEIIAKTWDEANDLPISTHWDMVTEEYGDTAEALSLELEIVNIEEKEVN